MELREVPIGAEFTFTKQSEGILKERIEFFIEQHLKMGYSKTDAYALNRHYIPNGTFTAASLLTGAGSAFSASNYKHTPPGVDYSKLTVEVVRPLADGYKKLTNYLPARQSFTTSCDPELFLMDGVDLLPAFKVLPVQKDAIGRLPSSFIPNVKSKFYQDGFGAEISPAPNQCHVYVSYHLADLIKGMMADVRLKYPNATISPLNFMEIPRELLKSATREQVSLGCLPSQNVYGTPAFTIDNPRDLPFRMVGGHIHLGSALIKDFLHSRVEPIIQAMDAFCAVPAVAMFEGIDDPRRREYYGRAGEFRLQPHGLEYRTLSNAWLCDPRIMHAIFNLARGAFRFGFMNWQEIRQVDPMRVQHIINNYDAAEARRFVEEYKPIISYLYDQDSGRVGSSEIKAALFALIERGVARSLPTWRNFEANWEKHESPSVEESHGRRLFREGYKGLRLGDEVTYPFRDEFGRFARAA